MLTQLTTLAQTSMDYSYQNVEMSEAESGAALGFMAVVGVVALILTVITIAGMWKVFKKAGKPGWAAIVPIYNQWVLFEIAGKPGWWALLSFIPVVNLVVIVLSIIATIELAKRFGKDIGYALLLIFVPVVGYPLLGFGDAKYQAPAGATGAGPSAPPSAPAGPTEPATANPAGPAPQPSSPQPAQPSQRPPRLIQ